MDRIYNKAKDKNVRHTVTYAAATGDYLSTTPGTTVTKVTKEEMKELFEKNTLVVMSEKKTVVPIAYIVDATGTYASLICHDGTNALTFYSSEYTAPSAG